MKTLYIIWQDTISKNRMWQPVAKATINEAQTEFTFQYTMGAKNPNFMPFPRMLDLSVTFKSPRLFPFFRNRMFPKNRPEFNDFLNWTNSEKDIDPIDLLALLGGSKATDNYRVIMRPTPIAGNYIQSFFVSGIRYVNEDAKKYIESLKEGDQLKIEYENDNKDDPNAVMLISTDEGLKLGYYPAYLNSDLRALLKENKQQYKVTVIKNNHDVPDQYRLFCHLETPWPDGFEPCSSELYQIFSKEL